MPNPPDAHPDAPNDAVEAAARAVEASAFFDAADTAEARRELREDTIPSLLQALVDGGHYVPIANYRENYEAAVNNWHDAVAERDAAVARAEAAEGHLRDWKLLAEARAKSREQFARVGDNAITQRNGARDRLAEAGDLLRRWLAWKAQLIHGVTDCMIRPATEDFLAVFDNPVTPEMSDAQDA